MTRPTTEWYSEYMTKTSTTYPASPSAYFHAALEGVESASIREWATSEHNRPIWMQIATKMYKQGKSVDDLTIYIARMAIGL